MAKNQIPSSGETKRRINRTAIKKSKGEDELKAQTSIDNTKLAYIGLLRLFGIMN